jgi:LemA protein
MNLRLLFAQDAGGIGGTAVVLIGIGIVVAVLVFLAIGTYNKLVQLRNRYKNAYSQIDVQLKRRYDLIPNLVETVKGYMGHERETLEAVIQARNAAVSASNQVASNPGDPESMKRLGAAEADLGSVSAGTGVLGRLFALSEAYPDLKANTNMLSLQEELTSTENKVAFSRQAYNDAVMNYNTAREVFPAVIFAGMFGFGPAQFFEVDSPKEREAPRVSFS